MDQTVRAPRPMGLRALRVLGWLAFSALATLTALTFSARFSFAGEIVASFRWQVGWVGVAIVLVLAVLRMRWLALVAFAASAYVLIPVLLNTVAPKPAHVEGALVRVETANLLFANPDRAGFRRFLAQESPDVLAVQEMTREWNADLDDLRAFYPERVTFPSVAKDWESRGFGLGLYTRLPVEERTVRFVRADSLPVLELVVRVGGRRVTLRTTHPASPQDSKLWAMRNDHLARMAREMPWDRNCVLLADLNTSSGSPAFQDLVDTAHLLDSRRGFGRLPTWSTDAPIQGLFVDVDHILVGAGIVVIARDTSAIPGSDHHAATATLTLAGL